MKRWSWIGIVGAALIVTAHAVSTAQKPATGAPTAPSRPAPPAPAPAQPAASARPGGAASPGRGAAPAAPGARPTEVRRQRSYATCNRAARRRDLSGGLRRSFITKCRLGLEKP